MAGPNDFTGQNIQDTYQRVLQISSSGQVTDGTGSLAPILQVTASHAISASVEILKEVSSSYAETASMASDSFFVQGDITASSNISASGNIQALTGSFTDYRGPLLSVTPDQQSIGDLDGNYYLVSAKFRQTLGRIDLNAMSGTEQKIVLSSKNLIIDDENGTTTQRTLIRGSITASGIISASGHIVGTAFRGNGRIYPGYNVSTAHFLGKTTVSNPIIKAAGGFNVAGHLTASGDVSASGDILGVNSKFVGTGSFDKGIAIVDPEWGGFNPGADLHRGWLINNEQAYTLKISQADGTDNFATFLNDGSSAIAIFNADISASSLDVSTSITASADISASGHIQADTGSFTKLQLSFANDTSDFIVANNQNSISLKVNNIENVNFTNATTTFSQPITASGNISASGEIYSSHLNTTGKVRLDTKTALFNDADELRLGYLDYWEKIVYGKQTTDIHEFHGSITASGDISASGNISTNQLNVGGLAFVDRSSDTFRMGFGAPGGTSHLTNFTVATDPGDAPGVRLNASSGDITSSGHISSSGGRFIGGGLSLKSSGGVLFSVFDDPYILSLGSDTTGGSSHVLRASDDRFIINSGGGFNTIEFVGASITASNDIMVTGDISASNFRDVQEVLPFPAATTNINNTATHQLGIMQITASGTPSVNIFCSDTAGNSAFRMYSDSTYEQHLLQGRGSQNSILCSSSFSQLGIGGDPGTNVEKLVVYGDVRVSNLIGISASLQSVTASSNISASGNLIASNAFVDTAVTFGGNKRLIYSSVDENIVVQDSSLKVNSDITASGAISASGFVYGDRGVFASRLQTPAWRFTDIDITSDNGPVNFNGASGATVTINTAGGHITASGNISASGNYIGSRQFDQSSTVDNNLTQGDIIYFGTGGSISAGDIVYLKSDGSWNKSDADIVARAKSLNGIALGSTPATDGVLLRGMYTLATDLGNSQTGSPLYLSGTEGELTATAPTSGVVRVMGYQLGDDDQIWFAPDNTWVELT